MRDKKYSILFALRTELKSYGGTENWLRDFIKVNHKKFSQVGVMKFRGNDIEGDIFLRKLIPEPDIEIINISDPGNGIIAKNLRRSFGEKLYSYFLYEFLLYFKNLRIRKELRKYELAYVTSYAMIIPIRLLNPHLKIVYGTHNNDFSLLKGKKRYSPGYVHAKLTLSLTDMVHFISKSSANNLDFRNKIITVSNGIDTNKYLPSMDFRSKNVVKVLFVGKLEEHKGVKIALEAINMLPQNEYYLTICGDGSLKDYVIAHKPNNCKYMSSPTDEELAEIYKDNDVFIFPTRSETFGLVVLEALASGLLIVASETLKPKFEEFAEMGVLLYSNRDSDSFVKALTSMSSKLPSEQKKREVYNLIKEKYSIYNLYEKIANGILEMCE